MSCDKYSVILFFNVLLNVDKWDDMIWHDKYVRWYSEWRWNRKRKEERGQSASYCMHCTNLSFVHIISHYIFLYLSLAYIIHHIIISYLILRSSTVLLNHASKTLLQLFFILKDTWDSASKNEKRRLLREKTINISVTVDGDFFVF